MAVFIQNAKALITKYLSFIDNVTYATASAGEKAAALLALNSGYRRYLSGEYVDDMGDKQTHLWSFNRVLAQITLRAGTDSYVFPDAYEGDIDKYVYDYHADVVRKKLKELNHTDLLARRRDDDTEDWPTHYSIIASAFAAATGSLYQWECWPMPESATITQLTTAVTRVTGPDFHSGLIGEDITITGETDVEVASVTSAD